MQRCFHACERIYSSAEGIDYAGLVNDEVRFRVYSNGDVRWMKPIPVTTACDVNIARFPFDSQTCTIEVVFWAWNGVDMFGNLSNTVNQNKCNLSDIYSVNSNGLRHLMISKTLFPGIFTKTAYLTLQQPLDDRKQYFH